MFNLFRENPKDGVGFGDDPGIEIHYGDLTITSTRAVSRQAFVLP